MRRPGQYAVVAVCWFLLQSTVVLAWAQTSSADEIPIHKCDLLPVVIVKIAGHDTRFLVDTAATTILNLKSFSSGDSKEVHITSWTGTAATSAREVAVPELVVGNHKLSNLKLPAIDLSPIGRACGGRIDGIFGVDLMDRMGITLDLQRRVATFKAPEVSAEEQMKEMRAGMDRCDEAFDAGNAAELEECFDPEIVLYTPAGEFRGRQQVMEYLKTRYLRFAPNLHFHTTVHDMRSFGNALWYSYDYRIDFGDQYVAGHGMAMCRKQGDRWLMLNMHNSLQLQPEPEAHSR
jgi:SnoaL-like domain/Aspartyl protease